MQVWSQTSFYGKPPQKDPMCVQPSCALMRCNQSAQGQCLGNGTIVRHMPHVSSFFCLASPAALPHSDSLTKKKL